MDPLLQRSLCLYLGILEDDDLVGAVQDWMAMRDDEAGRRIGIIRLAQDLFPKCRLGRFSPYHLPASTIQPIYFPMLHNDFEQTLHLFL